MMYEPDIRSTDDCQPNVLAAWTIYVMALAGLAMYSMISMLS